MGRLGVFLVSAIGLAMLATGPRRAELPPVSAPPPEPAPVVAAPDPAVAAIRDDLAWRHTGLSDREIWRVAETVVREAGHNGLDPQLVLAVIHVESGGYNFAVSSVGALGLMQLMPATGEELARDRGLAWQGPDSLFDPVLNVTLGAAYLRELSDRYGDWSAALAAYNWGPGRIDRRLRSGATLPSSYASEVLRRYESKPTPTRS